MKQCIVHIGMPKTGTTSIQQSFCFGLSDPAFRYLHWQRINCNSEMELLFVDSSASRYFSENLGWSARQIKQYKARVVNDLGKILASTPADVRPMISAEPSWRMQERAFTRLRTFMADRGYAVNIIAYIRPWKQWLESHFQQRIKGGRQIAFLSNDYAIQLDYRARIQMLDAIFGADQVQILNYAPKNFPEGCVVRDFCQQVGIRADLVQIQRANDSLTLPAVQLLYAYRKFGPGYGSGPQASMEKYLLNQQVLQLGGPSVRFHSSVVEPLIQKLAPQRPWLEQRLGSAFTEDIYKADDRSCIREEADLFDFAPATLDWLAAASHSAPVRATNRQEAALAVSAQVHRLRRMGSQKARFLRLQERIRRTVTQCRTGSWYAKPTRLSVKALHKGQQ